MEKTTRQAVVRLFSSPVEVRLFNGCFNVASVKASFSRYEVELRVEVTHPFLQWQCGNKNAVELIHWMSCEGYRMELPPELEPLVEKLREAATMTDAKARALSQGNAEAFAGAMEALGCAG
jgi:hypothetical protein